MSETYWPEFREVGAVEELFLRSQIPGGQTHTLPCTFLELGEVPNARCVLERELVGGQSTESDDDFRSRLLYVAGTDRRISIAMGTEPDAIAEEYGLRRRRSGRAGVS